MEIMTFNLRTDFPLDFSNRWDKRRDIVYDLLKTYHCDIIGVQEMTNNMYGDLKDKLSEYNVVGMPRSEKIFVERNDIFVSKKHEILDGYTFWLSHKPQESGSSKWYSLYPRICTTALVKLDKGEKVRIYNTHLDCFLPIARNFGFKVINNFIRDMDEKERIPIILMGDFNASPKSKLIKDIMNGKITHRTFKSVKLHDSTMIKKATIGGFKGKENGSHIDYIFITEEIKLNSSKIIRHSINGKFPSDHYPIYADVTIRSD